MLIEGQFTVQAPPEALMRHLFDAEVMASCVPGCERLEALDADRFRSVVVVSLAGITARFDLLSEVTQREALAVSAVTRGEEGGHASTLQAETRLTLTPAEAGGTVVAYRSDVTVTGRLGRFALGMMKKKAQSMGEEFANNLRTRLEALGNGSSSVASTSPTPPSVAPAAPAAPVEARSAASPPASWWSRLWSWLRGERAAAVTRRGKT
jgi:carbon monoxide dehydrogenase subunit G